jgi:hypothetical protein
LSISQSCGFRADCLSRAGLLELHLDELIDAIVSTVTLYSRTSGGDPGGIAAVS